MSLAEDWERLCNEQDSAWREYIRASRVIRDKFRSNGSQSQAPLTLADFGRENRAWIRVAQARDKLNSFVQRQAEDKPGTQRRSSR